jgi:HEAT repeat protein
MNSRRIIVPALLFLILGAAIALTTLRHRYLTSPERLPANSPTPSLFPAASGAADSSASPPPATSTPQQTSAGGSDDFRNWSATLKNPNASAADLRAALEGLAQLNTPEAMAELKKALSGNAACRAAIAEALAECDKPEAVHLLQNLAADTEEPVALAAIRSLAAHGTPEAVQTLSQIFANSNDSLNRRCLAAYSLATVQSPGAFELATRTILTSTEEPVVTQLLKGLGTRPIEETKEFLQNYLSSPAISSELKATAIESLSQAQGDPSPVLLASLHDANAQVRAAAAWALSDTLNIGNAGAELAGALQTETDPEVRRRLYQALGNQEAYDLGTIEAAIQKETDLSARLAGWNLLALTLQTRAPEGLAAYFDQYCLSDLKALVLNAPTPEARQRAIACLKLANTPAAQAILSAVPAAPAKKFP